MEKPNINSENAYEAMKDAALFNGDLSEALIEGYNKKSDELHTALLKLKSYALAKEQLNKVEDDIEDVAEHRLHSTYKELKEKIGQMELYKKVIASIEENPDTPPMELAEVKKKMEELQEAKKYIATLQKQFENSDPDLAKKQ
jgi:DNA repair ATPase RecN